MANCGCNSNPSNQNCYGRDHVKEQVLYPVLENNCSGNSNVSGNCPEGFQPFTRTGSGCVTVPAVGATFNLEVCDASKFVIGMWITAPPLGRYPIVGLNTLTNLLTLRNSCEDGTTAITGNPEPGSQFCGSLALWIGPVDPCSDAEAFCSQVFTCLGSISDENPLCLEDVPVTTEGQCVRMLGLSAACDSGDCPQPDDPNCLTKLDAVRFCEDTIVFDDGLRVASGDSEECFRPVVITDEGAFAQAPAGFGVVRPTKVKLVDISSGTGDGALISAAMNFQINLTEFGVPECAIGCFIRGFYILEFDSEEGGMKFNTFLRATGQPSNSLAYQITGVDSVTTETFDDRNMTDSWGGVSVLFGPDKIVYHEFQNTGSVGDNNSMRAVLFLDAIIQ
jgi:hypothetical protein